MKVNVVIAVRMDLVQYHQPGAAWASLRIRLERQRVQTIMWDATGHVSIVPRLTREN